MLAIRFTVVAALWLALWGGLYWLAAPYLATELAEFAGLLVAGTLAWWPVRPLYRRWNV